MKKLSIIAMALIAMSSCGKRVSSNASIKTGLDTFSYTQGIMVADFLKKQGVTEIDYNAMYRGLQEGLTKDSGYLIKMEDMNTLMQNYVTKAQKERIEPLRKKAKEYMDGLEKKGFTKLPEGGYYKINSKGNGINAKPYDTVEMNFTVKNIDGVEVLNSKMMAQGQTTKVPLSMLRLAPLETAMETIPGGSTFDMVLATDLYPFLGQFAKKFDDKYGISYLNFEIIKVTPGVKPAEIPNPGMPPMK